MKTFHSILYFALLLTICLGQADQAHADTGCDVESTISNVQNIINEQASFAHPLTQTAAKEFYWMI